MDLIMRWRWQKERETVPQHFCLQCARFDKGRSNTTGHAFEPHNALPCCPFARGELELSAVVHHQHCRLPHADGYIVGPEEAVSCHPNSDIIAVSYRQHSRHAILTQPIE
jgi:hypothetical protein